MEGYGCLAKDASTEQLRREISDLQTDVVQARDHLDMLVHLKGQLEYVNINMIPGVCEYVVCILCTFLCILFQ